MQLYNAKVRLSGNVLNEVERNAITAAEVIVLQAVHGADAVVNVKPVKMDKRNHRDERDRLEYRYGKPRIEQLFGPAHSGSKLPVKLDGMKARKADEPASSKPADDVPADDVPADDEPVQFVQADA